MVFEFKMAHGGHAVVATRYTERVKKYRHCENTQTGWFGGEKNKNSLLLEERPQLLTLL